MTINKKAQLSWGKSIGCIICQHVRYGKKIFCKSFPSGIPITILKGDVDHRYPLKGDKEIQFEMNEKFWEK